MDRKIARKIATVRAITDRITCSVFDTEMNIRVERDNIHSTTGRIFIQMVYKAPCTKTGLIQEWHGRKWCLSDFMTEDEIVKTAFAAFKAAVEHEVMEGFKFDKTIVFNPHVDFRELLKVSHLEIQRDQQ